VGIWPVACKWVGFEDYDNLGGCAKIGGFFEKVHEKVLFGFASMC
jgi:hypothetical protein